MYLIATSRAYYVITDKGASMILPENRLVLEALQDELEQFDGWVEELVTELILEERDLDS
jgi:hypothetical protein